MTTRTTSNQGAPFPDVNEPLNNMNDWIYALATFMEVRGVQRFTNAADLSTKRTAPTAGELAWINDTNILQVYDGTTWKRVYPPAPMIYSGTATPSTSLGAVGDLYIKTT
jgi:hypothetical protein